MLHFRWTGLMIVFALFEHFCDAAKVSYRGLQCGLVYSLIRVKIRDFQDVDWLRRFSDAHVQRADIWNYPTKSNPHIDMLISPDSLTILSKLLNDRGLSYSTILDNVESAIRQSRGERRRTKRQRPHSTRGEHFPADDYHSFEEIEAWLRRLNITHSKRFDLSSLGKTAEGRNLWLAKITSPPKRKVSNATRPAVFIDAGMHAREWVSHATALYLIKQLLHHLHRKNGSDSVIWNVDWYVVPVANPDGYVYSMTTDRLWRKSRSTVSSAYPCKGVDINRNFDYHWGEIGANTRYPCSNVYAGPRPLSEAETDAIASELRRLAPSLKAYISLHSYGQLLLAPWGYDTEKPENYLRQSELAAKAVAALKRVNQTDYTFGTIADLMYPASGTSVDFAHSLGIPFAFALELRPEDSDTSHGFLYPPEYILPTGVETFEAVKAIAKEIIN